MPQISSGSNINHSDSERLPQGKAIGDLRVSRQITHEAIDEKRRVLILWWSQRRSGKRIHDEERAVVTGNLYNVPT